MEKRGYVKEGYHADIVIVDADSIWEVSKENVLYKCGWSPFEGQQFISKITHTFVNGFLAYDNDQVNEQHQGQRLLFVR